MLTFSRENIEVVQDSSRRAVEAADNVVHAYDMDMSVPDGPTLLVPVSHSPDDSYITFLMRATSV